jgi:mannose-1-phosphate guanylyltransferase/mannose-6-phosphate isomerase
MISSIIPVIMCGGAGTRLWPVSRESMPKQFVPLIGAQSTFKQVLGRITDPDLFARPIVITRSDFRFIVAEQLRELGMEADIVLEPMPRDSGPAVAVAATLALERAMRSFWCSRPTISLRTQTPFARCARAPRAPRPKAA